ncbi:MAG: hypothetical protein AABY53_06805 [Bdellovibrionota bacterium]
MNNEKNSHNSDSQIFFTLYHVCEAVEKTDNSQLQLLSRILQSRLNDLKSVFEKIDFLESNIKILGNQNNPYHSKSELVSIDKRKSSMQKKKAFMLKHKRSMEVQILDTVKSIHRVFESNEGLNQPEAKSLIAPKLKQIEQMV